MTRTEIIKDIEQAVKTLEEGGIILYPTETIWGLGCDATNDAAIHRLIELKKRPDTKAMISLVDSIENLTKWVEEIPGIAMEEIQKSEIPLTVVYRFPKNYSPLLRSTDGSSALRITTLPYTRELCRQFGKPIVSTSANISGRPVAHTFSEIENDIKENVDYICVYGRNLKSGTPSRIIRITEEGGIAILR